VDLWGFKGSVAGLKVFRAAYWFFNKASVSYSRPQVVFYYSATI